MDQSLFKTAQPLVWVNPQWASGQWLTHKALPTHLPETTSHVKKQLQRDSNSQSLWLVSSSLTPYPKLQCSLRFFYARFHFYWRRGTQWSPGFESRAWDVARPDPSHRIELPRYEDRGLRSRSEISWLVTETNNLKYILQFADSVGGRWGGWTVTRSSLER